VAHPLANDAVKDPHARLELYYFPTETLQSLDDADGSGAKPGKKELPPALWAVIAPVIALAALAVEVKRPDIVRGALDSDAPFSSMIFGVIATAMCVFAVRRSVLRALPGIALTALYWVMLVLALR
jgi:hypothetical protein